MLVITAAQRRALRARAHELHPVVSIAQKGLTDAVAHEADVALKAHELIKVRVYNDDREEREAFLAELCERLNAAPIQHIGKLLVLYRPAPEDEDNAAAPGRRRGRREARRTKRSFQGSSEKE
ncbi:YhbY family RNA-binding protein [Oryzomicrobium sp.]|uniref:YhbY family RNA-binding protein n=1 Tax=Oryzomicrobium sp. TaxID=1911578 RepID=UPI0025FBC0EA|nr:YhbY family RNA-binding protein [Oryzomicrobium sp.]MCE1244598.1 YhbY family RNA-binding protein [Oryzomicrobium sp.]